MKQLTPNVYVSTTNQGCNTGFVVTSEGIVAHDTPMVPAEARAWAAEIARYGTLRYVINGEPHPDHISGNCFMGGILIGHEGTRDAILKMSVDEYRAKMAQFHPGMAIDKEFCYRAPDITIKENISIYLGKHTFRLLVMQGHTPWNVCNFVPEERVIFTSDTIIGNLPVLDDAMPREWIENLNYIQTLDVDFIIGGHGEVFGKKNIQPFIKDIQTWLDVVGDAIKKGMTLEEAKKNITMVKEFPALLENTWWKPNIVPANVAKVYTYLKNKKA